MTSRISAIRIAGSGGRDLGLGNGNGTDFPPDVCRMSAGLSHRNPADFSELSANLNGRQGFGTGTGRRDLRTKGISAPADIRTDCDTPEPKHRRKYNSCFENPQSEWNRFPSGWIIFLGWMDGCCVRLKKLIISIFVYNKSRGVARI